MRRNLKYIVLSICVLLSVRCSDKYEQPSPDYSKGRMVATFENGAKYNIGDVLTLMDLSQGVVERTWSVDEDASFAEGSANTDKIGLTYSTPGLKNITLNVSFIDPSLTFENSITATILKNVKAEWMSTQITDSDTPQTTGPNIDGDSGEVIDPSQVKLDYKPLTIEAGDFIDYVAITEGTPSNFHWILPGSDKEEVDDTLSRILRAGYYAPGTYDATLIAYRSNPVGADTVYVKNYVTVTASDRMGKLRSVEMNENGDVVLAFTQQLETPESGANGFSVTRNDEQTKVTSVALDPSDLTKVVLKVSGGMYNGDDLSVSYDGSVLKTLSGTGVEAFDDEVCVPYIENIFTDGGFESTSLVFVSYEGWDLTNPCYCTLSTENPYSGAQSMKIAAPATVVNELEGIKVANKDTYDITLKDGVKYKVEFYYCAQDTEWSTSLMEMRSGGIQFNGGTMAMTADVAGEWKKAEYIWTQSAGDGKAFFEIIKVGVNRVIYIDDLKVYEYFRHDATPIEPNTDVDGSTIPNHGAGVTL